MKLRTFRDRYQAGGDEQQEPHPQEPLRNHPGRFHDWVWRSARDDTKAHKHTNTNAGVSGGLSGAKELTLSAHVLSTWKGSFYRDLSLPHLSLTYRA